MDYNFLNMNYKNPKIEMLTFKRITIIDTILNSYYLISHYPLSFDEILS